jgi:hypothetical protein
MLLQVLKDDEFAASYSHSRRSNESNDFELGYRSAQFEFGPLPDLSMTKVGPKNLASVPVDESNAAFSQTSWALSSFRAFVILSGPML